MKQPYPYQEELIKESSIALRDDKAVCLQAPTGAGKCLAKGTKVLMFDGSIKKVEHISVGDRLMGPDSEPRTVTSLCQGFEEMFDIIPTKGDKYTVNRSHILSLRMTGNKCGTMLNGVSYNSGDIVNLSIDDYLNSTKTFKHCAKGYRASVDFPSNNELLLLDPYFVGLWLGDGTKRNSNITTADDEIIEYLKEYAPKIHCRTIIKESGNHSTVTIADIEERRKGRYSGRVLHALRHHKLWMNKHIPKEYKTASRIDRLKLLAGLFDSDGSVSRGGVDYISELKHLAEDVCYVARSLGFAAYMSKCTKTCTNSTYGRVQGTYYRVSVSGDLSIIPTILKRKKIPVRKQIKNVLNVGIEVKSVGVGEYYGFTIDGDHLFLLSDFTVTHNTVIMLNMIHRGLSKGNTFLVISETRKIYKQLVDEFKGVEINSNVKSIYVQTGKCYVAMAQTLNRRPIILEQFKRLGNKLIVMADECHINTMTPILLALKESGAFVLGLTATPFYDYAKHLPTIYNTLVPGPQVEELIQLKKLCNYKHIARTRGDLSLLELRNGEYTEASQEMAFNTAAVYDGLYDDLTNIPFNKCIIFVASIKAADDLNENLLSKGFKSVRFHSKLKGGEFELAKFTKLNEANILVTIRSLSKGWDHKPIDLVVLNHKTTSPALYLQEIGRGSRIIDGQKYFFTVLDYGDNWKQHGLYFEERDFTKLWNQTAKKKKKLDVAAPIKTCPSCDSLLSASVRKCMYCQFDFPIEVKELEVGELVEITSDYSKLAGKKVSDLDPFQLSVYVKTLNKKPYGARVARTKETDSKGFLKDYAGHMGYKPSWIDYQIGLIEAENIGFADLTLR